MSRRLLGIGISASLLIVLLVARVGGETTGRGAGASPTAPIGPSSPVLSSVGSLVTGAIGSMVGPSVLSMKTGKPLTEQHMAARPGYAEYVTRTSGFLPWPPKRPS